MSRGHVYEWWAIRGIDVASVARTFKIRGLVRADADDSARAVLSDTVDHACCERGDWSIAYARDHAFADDRVGKLIGTREALHLEHEETGSYGAVEARLNGEVTWRVSYTYDSGVVVGGEPPSDVARLVAGSEPEAALAMKIGEALVVFHHLHLDAEIQLFVAKPPKLTRSVLVGGGAETTVTALAPVLAAVARLATAEAPPFVRFTIRPLGKAAQQLYASVEGGRLRVEALANGRYFATAFDGRDLAPTDLPELFRAFYRKGERSDAFKWLRV